ncbi:MAG: nucleotidyl transferase AbiEii/AbiGii toxin family protein [bacterium]|nr:nucleotidyl transferase AbiEii/AbiGii toxin family protein [bacterium]MDT8396255.1 nucleotidyl transferase AbiEii/AbiGii toxin family protein [bacterium]
MAWLSGIQHGLLPAEAGRDRHKCGAGKMHALLCRGWGNRVKGRDWYDFVWYVGRGTDLDLRHLEARVRRSGHYTEHGPLTEERFLEIVKENIFGLDVDKAKADVVKFLSDVSSIEVWSRDFFLNVAGRVKFSKRS